MSTKYRSKAQRQTAEAEVRNRRMRFAQQLATDLELQTALNTVPAVREFSQDELDSFCVRGRNAKGNTEATAISA